MIRLILYFRYSQANQTHRKKNVWFVNCVDYFHFFDSTKQTSFSLQTENKQIQINNSNGYFIKWICIALIEPIFRYTYVHSSSLDNLLYRSFLTILIVLIKKKKKLVQFHLNCIWTRSDFSLLNFSFSVLLTRRYVNVVKKSAQFLINFPIKCTYISIYIYGRCT